MKKSLFALLAVCLLCVGITSDGYAAPVEHTTNAAKEISTPDDGEPGNLSLDEAREILRSHQAGENQLAVVATYDLTNAGTQQDDGGGASTPREDDLDEIVDEAIDHWYERPVGESMVAWIGWIVAALLLLWRAVKYFQNKQDDSAG